MDRANILERLRFVQRVLEGNPPEDDKRSALAMVRDMRRELMIADQAEGAAKVRRVLDLLRANPQRDLYEGAGTGGYYVTYTSGEQYAPLSVAQVTALEQAGTIKAKYPGCFVLSGA